MFTFREFFVSFFWVSFISFLCTTSGDISPISQRWRPHWGMLLDRLRRWRLGQLGEDSHWKSHEWNGHHYGMIIFINLIIWLVFWNIFFSYIGNNNPNWQIFFRGGEATNQSFISGEMNFMNQENDDQEDHYDWDHDHELDHHRLDHEHHHHQFSWSWPQSAEVRVVDPILFLKLQVLLLVVDNVGVSQW